MLNTIIGIKLGQTQRFTSEGRRIPVTKIEAGPCQVVQIKTQKENGYHAFQLGFGSTKESNMTKPMSGKFKKAGIKNYPRFLREVKTSEEEALSFKLGQTVKLEDIFKVGDRVHVAGVTVGKGFAGVVKRWHFKGGPRTHGQSDRERAPGSIGSTTTPGRVLKGKKMAGHLGKDRATVRNLEVVLVDPEKNLLEIKGLVPGKGSNLLLIRKAKDGITS